MSRKRIKQYLTLLMAIGVIAVVAGGSGTFASFTATTTTADNTFTTGSLFLHSTKDGGTECDSEWKDSSNHGAGATSLNSNTSCEAYFTAGDLAGGLQAADVTVTNAGSILGAHLTLQATGCTIGANDTNEPTFATPTCGDINVDVVERDTASGGGTTLYCAYGTASSTDCNVDGSTTLATLGTVQNLLSGAATDATLTAGQTRHYVIEIEPNLSLTGNQLQNLKLTFKLTWQLTQA